MAKSQKTWSLKEIDQARGDTKGTAFRAFKQLKGGFDEGRDYFYLSSQEDPEAIRRLRQSGRVYATTINALLLTEPGYAAILDYLED